MFILFSLLVQIFLFKYSLHPKLSSLKRLTFTFWDGGNTWFRALVIIGVKNVNYIDQSP
jgi:hypothetical protein